MALPPRTVILGSPASPTHKVDPIELAALLESMQVDATSAIAAGSAAEVAQSEAEAARDAAFVNADVYPDVAAGLAATSEGDQFQVVSGTDIIRYRHDAGPVATEVARINSLANLLTPKKNLFDKSRVRVGKRYSPGSDTIITDATGRCTHFIPVVPGQIITISGGESSFTGGWFETESDTAAATDLGFASGNQITATVPADRFFLVVNLTADGSGTDVYDDTLQVEVNYKKTNYEAYTLIIDPEKIKTLSAIDMVDDVGTNLIDPDSIDFVKRYSTGTLGFTTDTLGIAASDWIPVDEGQTYTLSGAYYNTPNTPQGGYFTSPGATSAHSNITWIDTPDGSGKSFIVPTGAGITHVVVSLWKDGRTAASTTLEGNVQLQKGEIATAYENYELKRVISNNNLPNAILNGGSGSGGSTVSITDSAWFKYVEGENQPYNRDKWPVFSEKMLLKSADVTVVSVGTSLTARTTEHHSDHPHAKNRPPLMHSLNEASYIWDAMSRGWEGQKYARYDDSEIVTEILGTWSTSHNLGEWDDGAYRNGLTRSSDTDGAQVSFDVPAGTWAWRFIHRTDTVASEALSVAISGGNGIAEVWDDVTSAWVEANGYSFSQREDAPVTRSISIPNPDTDVFSSSTIASKGNTTYQKRLKFRFVDRTSSRTVTITNSDTGSRFNYWGCEWSPREFMLTYVNAARGSFSTQATSTNGLPRVADNEVHSFKPDLIYGELPIHNDGAAGIGVYSTWDRWGRLANNYVWRADYELSLATRAEFFGYTPEFGWWTPSIAYGFGGIGEDGSLLTSTMTDGRVMTALDKFDQAVAWIRSNHDEAVVVHAVRRWVDAGFSIYGDLKTATQASGKSGPSMTNDGGHSNDVGAKVLAKLLVGPLNFEK